jgi:predicted HicB family RNase H-like nuclease
MNTKDTKHKKRMTLRVNPKIYESVKEEADKRSVSMNVVISNILYDEFNKTG